MFVFNSCANIFDVLALRESELCEPLNVIAGREVVLITTAPSAVLCVIYTQMPYHLVVNSSRDFLYHTVGLVSGGGGVLTYLAERGCAALMGHFFTRNP